MSVRRCSLAVIVAALLSLGLAGLVQAHVHKTFGTFQTAMGWQSEPAYVGYLNAIQVIVDDAQGDPLTDLAAGDLTVTVTAAGKTSAALPLAPTYRPSSGKGTPGEYVAAMIPTVPGDYTLHLQGSIHGTAVDETATSSDTTFAPVGSGNDVQFPVAVPAAGDLSTGLDRLNSRVQAADDAAQQALEVGAGVGVLGIIVGLVAIGLSLRRRRPAAS